MQALNLNKLGFVLILLGAWCVPSNAVADVLGDQQVFSVDPIYDARARDEVTAVLQVANSTVYFYVEKDWWGSLSLPEQEKGRQALIALGQEFEQNAYPRLTQTFGSEWKPGIDKSSTITVLLHEMQENAGGYTNSGDEFFRVQNPRSNEREMMYLNAKNLQSPLLKSFLAHEFVHVITFNQKNKLNNVEEEVWLNELRAEYAATLLGYDFSYETSMIKQRVQNFFGNTGNSVTEWLGTTADYGVINLFAQYIVDQYGVAILVDSLRSKEVGIASLNEALAGAKFQKSFSDVFTDWTIALFLNDCTYGERYCYHNPHLVNLRVVPQTNFLPSIGNSTLTLNNSIKDWSGNWMKILGGKEVLQVQFQGSESVGFRVPYVIENIDRTFSVGMLALNTAGKGTIVFSDFNTTTRSVIFIPVAQVKTTNLNTAHPLRTFSLVISATERTPQEEEALIAQLVAQIEFLKQEIAKVKAQIAATQSTGVQQDTCSSFTQNLSFGMRNDQVRCLQEFLVAQGSDIYPEKVVSGNFLTLTHQAVIRFQKKYAVDILAPLGLQQGTGYVGSSTRAKINALR